MNENDDLITRTGMSKTDVFALVEAERQRRRIPVTELCARAGITHPPYYKWIHGQAEPRIASLIMLMAALIRRGNPEETPDDGLEAAVRELRLRHRQAVQDPKVRNPVTWSLYRTWSKFDLQDEERRRTP